MLCDYQDITDLLGTPLWWDQYGVPRYADFHPDMLGVYHNFALLVRIECQACRTRMRVGCGFDRVTLRPKADVQSREFEVVRHDLQSLAEGFRFGDPPWHGCRGGGESMQSVAVRIEEAWHRPKVSRWERDRQVELIDVRPDWDK